MKATGASEEAKRRAASGAFDFLIEDKRHLLKTPEVAACFGRGGQYVLELIEEGKLEAFAPTGRQVKRYTITRRSALLHLAETAEFDPGEFHRRVNALLQFLTPAQLAETSAAIAKRGGAIPAKESEK